MKVICEGNDTVDISEIQSVSVDTAAKRIEVHLKRKTGETEEKVRDLPLRKSFFEKRTTWAEEVKEDLERFSKAPNTPIEEVIPNLKVYTALAAFMKCENPVSLARAA